MFSVAGRMLQSIYHKLNTIRYFIGFFETISSGIFVVVPISLIHRSCTDPLTLGAALATGPYYPVPILDCF